MNLTGIEKGLKEQLENQITDRIRESIRQTGEKIIEEEIGKFISQMHVVMTKVMDSDQVEFRYLVSFKKDK